MARQHQDNAKADPVTDGARTCCHYFGGRHEQARGSEEKSKDQHDEGDDHRLRAGLTQIEANVFQHADED